MPILYILLFIENTCLNEIIIKKLVKKSRIIYFGVLLHLYIC